MLGEAWKKSPYSINGGECVEARLTTSGADVRDTQNRDTATLSFPAGDWRALLHAER
ncbi:DUF397 domain-containing protein [Nocardiopsis metallicus]|uniref:DUF397 domain-containing protein n=1 Tax=Nocardiopsis metallicus TaxID=179819 RepID=UPI00160D5F0D|nr:DUF397 domain-containing protein [Nocardiopsis metallicus]